VRRDLGALSGRRHDLVVVGGGIYGAAAAWDAAQRGLATALVERADFGSGTSWNSLKTIHGGLRHLQRGELGLLRESVRERRTLLRIAPLLVRPLPFLVPAYGHGPRGREALAAGLWLNDLIARDRNDGLPAEQSLPRGRLLTPGEAVERVPGLPRHGLTGAILYHDAQVASSERLLLAFLHAAADAGAALANHLEVVGLLRRDGRVAGVRALDRERGGELEIEARLVLNAAGPWADDVAGLAGLGRPRTPLLRARNLVLRRPLAPGLAVGARSGGRFLFLVPWGGRSLAGTDYVPAEAPEDPARVAAFRDELVSAFPWAGLTADDVGLVHVGLVPGRGGADGLLSGSALIDHETEDGVAGLISAYGAKYTTARATAEKAVDLACRRLGIARACRTAGTPLARARSLAGPLAEQARLAAREEAALHLDDALLRRLDLATAGPPADEDAATVAGALAGELGWDAARLDAERARLARALKGHLPPIR
jgi:glycerol-3-phosphate dehydrogenase